MTARLLSVALALALIGCDGGPNPPVVDELALADGTRCVVVHRLLTKTGGSLAGISCDWTGPKAGAK